MRASWIKVGVGVVVVLLTTLLLLSMLFQRHHLTPIKSPITQYTEYFGIGSTNLAGEGKQLLRNTVGKESPLALLHTDGTTEDAPEGLTTLPMPRLVLHVFGFDRPTQFIQLWNSITKAEPATKVLTSVIIHVDHDETNGTDWQLQVQLATHLASHGGYKHGPVSALFASKNKGLRATMLEAWAPLEGEYAMFLEDDIEVSSLLFTFAQHYIVTYGEIPDRDPNILGYKLYSQKWDEVNQKFENTINNGAVPFKLQEPCSWGSIFVAEPYSRYLHWYVRNKHIDPNIPNAWSNTWNPSKSAKKYMQRFMWETGMYLLAINIPDHLSLTTPRVSSGTNIKPQWLDFLKARLEVDLLTKQDVIRLQRQGVDPFASPPASQLWILDTTHTRVAQIEVPTDDQIKELGGAELPGANIIDPKNLKGARWTIIDKAKKELQELLEQPRAEIPKLPFSQAWVTALKEILLHSKRQRLPASFVDSIAGDPFIMYVVASMLHGPPYQRVLVADLQYGMTNRLRALGSAKAIADATGRLLVAIWEPDAHCYARLSDLLEVPGRGTIVVDNGASLRALLDIQAVRDSYIKYDLMKPEAKFIQVDGTSTSNIYVRSAFQVFSKAPYQNAHIISMRELSNRGSAAVRAIIAEYHGSLPSKTPDSYHAAMVGVHVRMVAVVTEDTPGLTEEEALRMELATAFRVSCHYRYFLERMLEYPATTRFFLSSDSPEAYSHVSKHQQLKGRVFFVQSQGCTERSPRCMAYAAADLLLLSRTSELLASKWSAFSETAGKLGGMPVHDGCDEPAGGWKLKGPSAVLTNQVIKYLKDKQFPGVDRVANALGRFKM